MSSMNGQPLQTVADKIHATLPLTLSIAEAKSDMQTSSSTAEIQLTQSVQQLLSQLAELQAETRAVKRQIQHSQSRSRTPRSSKKVYVGTTEGSIAELSNA